MINTFSLEQEWKKSLPKLTLGQWIEIFPEAKGYLNYKLMKLKKLRGLLREEAQKDFDRIQTYAERWDRIFFLMKLKHFVLVKIQRINKEIRDIFWAINPQISNPSGITNEMIQRAKAFPIDQLLEVNSRFFSICPFHRDSRPSLYTKNNYFKCFSCGWCGDTIQFVMQRDGLSFKEAVKKLS